jgi:hypothetical protein
MQISKQINSIPDKTVVTKQLKYSGAGKFCRFKENKLRLAKNKGRFQKNKCH